MPINAHCTCLETLEIESQSTEVIEMDELCIIHL